MRVEPRRLEANGFLLVLYTSVTLYPPPPVYLDSLFLKVQGPPPPLLEGSLEISNRPRSMGGVQVEGGGWYKVTLVLLRRLY